MAKQNYADILTHIFITPLLVASLLGNSLVIIVKFYRKKSKVFNGGDLLITNLAISDINKTWVVYMTWIYGFVLNDKWNLGNTACVALQKLAMILFSVTSLTLLLLTLDRYFLIVKPFDRSFTLPRIRKFLAALWVSIILVNSYPQFMRFGIMEIYGIQQCGSLHGKMTVTSVFEILYLIIIIIVPCFIIFHLSRKAGRKLCKSMKSCCQQMKTSRKFNEKMRRNKNAIYILRSVTIGSLLCYVPWSTHFIVQMKSPEALIDAIDQTILQPIIAWIIFGGFCNTPLTYLMFSKEFRKEIRNIFQKRRQSKSISSRISPNETKN